jgi:hypothetical protein
MVERWRHDTGRHGDLGEARRLVDLLLPVFDSFPPGVIDVHGYSRRLIDIVASLTVLKKDLTPR